jgi:hypothetical protein
MHEFNLRNAYLQWDNSRRQLNGNDQLRSLACSALLNTSNIHCGSMHVQLNRGLGPTTDPHTRRTRTNHSPQTHKSGNACHHVDTYWRIESSGKCYRWHDWAPRRGDVEERRHPLDRGCNTRTAHRHMLRKQFCGCLCRYEPCRRQHFHEAVGQPLRAWQIQAL